MLKRIREALKAQPEQRQEPSILSVPGVICYTNPTRYKVVHGAEELNRYARDGWELVCANADGGFTIKLET